MIGFLGGIEGTEPSYLEAFLRCCLVRGVQVGNRAQFEEMNRAVDAFGIKPMVDEKEFGFEELKEAYQYMVSAYPHTETSIGDGELLTFCAVGSETFW